MEVELVWKDLGEGREYHPNTLGAVPRELNMTVKLCRLRQLTSDGAIIYECHCWTNYFLKMSFSYPFHTTPFFPPMCLPCPLLKFFFLQIFLDFWELHNTSPSEIWSFWFPIYRSQFPHVLNNMILFYLHILFAFLLSLCPLSTAHMHMGVG